MSKIFQIKSVLCFRVIQNWTFVGIPTIPGKPWRTFDSTHGHTNRSFKWIKYYDYIAYTVWFYLNLNVWKGLIKVLGSIVVFQILTPIDHPLFHYKIVQIALSIMTTYFALRATVHYFASTDVRKFSFSHMLNDFRLEQLIFI